MPITAYSQVISLADAANYLRIDEDLMDDDLIEEKADVEQMRDAALSFVERKTNHIVLSVDRKYPIPPQSNVIRVYDFPINNLIDSTLEEDEDYEVEVKNNYSEYKIYDSDTLEQGYIEINVGYDTKADVPAGIIQLAKNVLKQYYYEQQNMRPAGAMPGVVKHLINQFRRFLV